eukprot:9859527-Alexandrium_andersonii.AAC.1
MTQRSPLWNFGYHCEAFPGPAQFKLRTFDYPRTGVNALTHVCARAGMKARRHACTHTLAA